MLAGSGTDGNPDCQEMERRVIWFNFLTNFKYGTSNSAGRDHHSNQKSGGSPKKGHRERPATNV